MPHWTHFGCRTDVRYAGQPVGGLCVEIPATTVAFQEYSVRQKGGGLGPYSMGLTFGPNLYLYVHL